MKLCNKCKINPVRGEKQYTCKDCHNDYQKKFYKKNPWSTSDYGVRRKLAIRKLITDAKSIPCTDCHISYPYYVMEFDHLRDKKFNLSGAAIKHYSLDNVKNEMAKCDVVCANCHRERTFNRI